jgi:hypothetical protein
MPRNSIHYSAFDMNTITIEEISAACHDATVPVINKNPNRQLERWEKSSDRDRDLSRLWTVFLLENPNACVKDLIVFADQPRDNGSAVRVGRPIIPASEDEAEFDLYLSAFRALEVLIKSRGWTVTPYSPTRSPA